MNLFGVDVEFIINDKEIEVIAPILEQWVKINRDYIEQSENSENYYWYNERANISALAGAVWRCGGFASEEYSAPKGADNKMGRVDLHFVFAQKEIICEAKHGWLYLTQDKDKDYASEIKGCLDEAKHDIERTLKAHKPDLGLGIAFLAPYWDASKKYPEKAIRNLKAQLKELDASFCIYFENKTTNPSLKGKENNEAFNSIVLVGKIST